MLDAYSRRVGVSWRPICHCVVWFKHLEPTEPQTDARRRCLARSHRRTHACTHPHTHTHARARAHTHTERERESTNDWTITDSSTSISIQSGCYNIWGWLTSHQIWCWQSENKIVGPMYYKNKLQQNSCC